MAKNKQKKAFYKRWWIYPVGLVVILIIIAVSTPGQNTTTTASTTPQPSKTINTTAKKNAPKKVAKKVASTPKIGQEVKVGKLEYKVNSISYQLKLNDGGTGMAPSANGGVWMIVNITVKNNDTQSRTLDTTMFTVLKGKTKYDASSEADAFINNNSSFFLSNVNPGLSDTGNIGFNVPSKGTYQLKVTGSMFSIDSATIDLHK